MTAAKLAIVAIIAGIVAPVVAHAQPWDETRLRNVYGAAVLFIEGEATLKSTPKPSKWTGTAFVVHDKGWALTNHHVTQPANLPPDQILTIRLTARPGSNVTPLVYPVTIVKRDAELDLALLRLPDRADGWQTVVQIADSNRVRDGDSAFVLGFPLGKGLDVRGGKIGSANAEAGRFRTNTALNHGNSGGPVFGDDGRVVGVVYGGVDEAQNFAYFIPINYARGLLRLVAPGW
jgi:S1-C subfamily serine protease